MLNLKLVAKFKKDFKKYRHNKVLIKEFEEVINLIQTKTPLPQKYSDHFLLGTYKGMRECHIKPDILLVYWISEETQTLYLERINSHSELFD